VLCRVVFSFRVVSSFYTVMCRIVPNLKKRHDMIKVHIQNHIVPYLITVSCCSRTVLFCAKLSHDRYKFKTLRVMINACKSFYINLWSRALSAIIPWTSIQWFYTQVQQKSIIPTTWSFPRMTWPVEPWPQRNIWFMQNTISSILYYWQNVFHACLPPISSLTTLKK
jgi:hypothetical protein